MDNFPTHSTNKRISYGICDISNGARLKATCGELTYQVLEVFLEGEDSVYAERTRATFILAKDLAEMICPF